MVKFPASQKDICGHSAEENLLYQKVTIAHEYRVSLADLPILKFRDLF